MAKLTLLPITVSLHQQVSQVNMPRPARLNIPKYHWVRDTPDVRDHLYAAAPVALPTSVDLRQYCSTIEDQGQLGSCTGNAIAGIIELMQRKQNPAKGRDVSRLFIYYEARMLSGTVNYDSGAYIRDGIKVVNKKGAPLENLWPYLSSRLKTRPTTAAYYDALKRKATAYKRVADFAGVKTALRQGYPVVIGFDVYESFETQSVANTGMMPYPNINTEQLLGGHAVALVGYDDNLNGGRFICRNSWGPDWGDRGYFYMPYQVIQNTSMSSDFWIITSVTNP
jgi:C1A family cysteine protease